MGHDVSGHYHHWLCPVPRHHHPAAVLHQRRGLTATFTVTATGTEPLAYQWQKYSVTDFTDLADRPNAAVTLTNLASGDGGEYRVVITNFDGAATSDVARLTVLLPPTLQFSAASYTVSEGLAPPPSRSGEVLGLLADKPQVITARDVQRARIVALADEAHALLQRLEAEGELEGQDSMPEGGGTVSRIYTKAGGKAVGI